MSIFDPQGLYIHHQKSTKKGQIIQKKPQKRLSAISKEEIPRSLMVLKTYGYSVIPPGSEAIFPAGKSFLSAVAGTPESSNYAVTFNQIWNIVKNEFNEILSIPLSRVTSGELLIAISSINIPTINSSGQRTGTRFTSDYINDIKYSSQNNVNLMYQAYNSTQAILVMSSEAFDSRYLINSTGDFMIAGHIANDWTELVMFGGLNEDVTLFTLSRENNDTFGEISFTLSVNAKVNYN